MRIVLLFIFTFAAMQHCVQCFCVYNKSTDETYISIYQIGGFQGIVTERFRQWVVKPGEKACCPYTEKTCVNQRDPRNPVILRIHRLYPGRQDLGRYDISCPGGGWISMGGNKDSPDFKVYWADGSDFPATIEYQAHSY